MNRPAAFWGSECAPESKSKKSWSWEILRKFISPLSFHFSWDEIDLVSMNPKGLKFHRDSLRKINYWSSAKKTFAQMWWKTLLKKQWEIVASLHHSGDVANCTQKCAHPVGLVFAITESKFELACSKPSEFLICIRKILSSGRASCIFLNLCAAFCLKPDQW